MRRSSDSGSGFPPRRRTSDRAIRLVQEWMFHDSGSRAFKSQRLPAKPVREEESSHAPGCGQQDANPARPDLTRRSETPNAIWLAVLRSPVTSTAGCGGPTRPRLQGVRRAELISRGPPLSGFGPQAVTELVYLRHAATAGFNTTDVGCQTRGLADLRTAVSVGQGRPALCRISSATLSTVRLLVTIRCSWKCGIAGNVASWC
jgi:hypothetical protein